MGNFRSYETDVEVVAQDWRRQSLKDDLAWATVGNPGEAGGEAAGFFVRCGALEGYAKPSMASNDPANYLPRAAHEKIVSDLAFDLGLPVPPVILWRRTQLPTGHEHRCAVSLVPFKPPHKWEFVLRTPGSANRIEAGMSAVASAMDVFDTWVDNRDRMNGGNLLVGQSVDGGKIKCAYIDYSNALSHGWGHGPAPDIAALIGRYPTACLPDPKAAHAAVEAIESLTEDAIRSIVIGIPDEFLTAARRTAIIDGLLSRRAGLRRASGASYGEKP